MITKKTLFKFFIFFMFIQSFCYNLRAQEKTSTESKNKEFQFRITWVGADYSYFDDLINDRVTKKHLFMYDIQEESHENGRDEYYNSIYRYYNLGFAFSKTLNNINKFQLFMRCRFDHFYYSHESVDNHYYHNPATNDTAYLDVKSVSQYSVSTKSWQLTPGIGIMRKLKFMNIQIGAEVPLYLRGVGKSLFVQLCDGYNTLTGDRVSELIYEPELYPGGYFVGLSLFGNLSASFKSFSLGIEQSVGFVFINTFLKSQIIQTQNHFKFALHYPALTFAYKFGSAK
ncbi:MAG: hypothetical protein V2A54_06915 [Bacteroidota bacterium]